MAKSISLSAADKKLESPGKDWPDVKVMAYLSEVRGMKEEAIIGYMRGWQKVKQGRSV